MHIRRLLCKITHKYINIYIYIYIYTTSGFSCIRGSLRLALNNSTISAIVLFDLNSVIAEIAKNSMVSVFNYKIANSTRE